ncbi:transposase [Exiguobacterium sp. SH5S13]|uniref:transposase n=1 Tax=Exiguobacterium sp. SH5S13 TaxID=2510959 RepID=UPI001375B32E|nr:transposase [Exiguobacterium sp. SH5S13]
MSAKEAERVTTVLGFRISHDTLLRVLRRVPIPNHCAEIIGIDDFAFKKGHRYGTIICDAITHRPVDLLRTREADMLTDWLLNLEKRPVRASVDRFPAYQEALLNQDIVVVSDRFHLIDNLWRCLNSICQRVLPSRIPVNPEGAVSYGLKPQHPTEPRKETKRPLVEMVQSMYHQGMSLNAIARVLNLNWRTVKKYSDPTYEPSPSKRQRPHLIDRFMPHLRECVLNRYTLKETDAYLRHLGYRGSFGAVRYRSLDVRKKGLPEPQVFISRKDVCRLLWQWPSTRPGDIIDVSYLLVHYGDLAIPFCFIQGFREAIRERDAEHLLALITNPQVTSHPGLKRFVGRLKQNIEVILAACRFEENNGYVEGNVNRLKMLKRLMYGRGGFDLLRIRVLCRNPEPSPAH